MADRSSALSDALRKIEDRVLEDVWIGATRLTVGGVLAASLAVISVGWWVSGYAVDTNHTVPTVSAALFMAASLVSGIATVRRRFRWCCAALYCCGLATVVGLGALWWLRTGHHGSGVLWVMSADLAAIVLALGWLTVIGTPIERSQPDMRTTRAG